MLERAAATRGVDAMRDGPGRDAMTRARYVSVARLRVPPVRASQPLEPFRRRPRSAAHRTSRARIEPDRAAAIELELLEHRRGYDVGVR